MSPAGAQSGPVTLLTFTETQSYHWPVTGAIEALFKFLAEYSWRAFVGIFVATGAILFFPDALRVTDWARPLRGYLVAVFILSFAVLATFGATLVQAKVSHRRDKRVDLRMVPGGTLHASWSVSVTPPQLGKKPMMILMCQMHFAHAEDWSVILKRAYLKGTREAFPMADVVVEGSCDQPESICIGLTPLKVKPGQDLVGKLIFVDQFNEKHISEKITFRPNTIPANMHANHLQSSPNCVFCNQPVTLEDQAKEAQMTAHTACIWR